MISPQIARLEDELSRVRKSLRSQRAETRIEKKNNEKLRSELAQLRHSLGRPEPITSSSESAEHEKAQHAAEMDELRGSYEARAAEIEAKCAREIANLQEKQSAKLSALRNSLRTAEELTLAKTERIKRLEARLAKLQADDVVLPKRLKTACGADDLTVLRGVGPAFARALRRCGVDTFLQIARWSEDDIERFAPRIGTTAGRIRKDKWVSEARKFAKL